MSDLYVLTTSHCLVSSRSFCCFSADTNLSFFLLVSSCSATLLPSRPRPLAHDLDFDFETWKLINFDLEFDSEPLQIWFGLLWNSETLILTTTQILRLILWNSDFGFWRWLWSTVDYSATHYRHVFYSFKTWLQQFTLFKIFFNLDLVRLNSFAVLQLVLFLNCPHFVTSLLLLNLYWLKIKLLIQFNVISFTYKTLKSGRHSYLYNFLNFRSNSVTRSSDIVTVLQFAFV